MHGDRCTQVLLPRISWSPLGKSQDLLLAASEALSVELLPEESLDFNDLFNLSTSLLWNIDNEDIEFDFGGEGEFDLLGDCKLECEVLDEFLENWREEIANGTER